MGFRTVIERFTEGDRLTVIILCNRTDLNPEKLAFANRQLLSAAEVSHFPLTKSPESFPRAFQLGRAQPCLPYCFIIVPHLQILF